MHDGGFPVGDWLWRPSWKCGFPGKVMADRETQKLERKDFFQRIVEKVDGGGGGFLNGPFGETSRLYTTHETTRFHSLKALSECYFVRLTFT